MGLGLWFPEVATLWAPYEASNYLFSEGHIIWQLLPRDGKQQLVLFGKGKTTLTQNKKDLKKVKSINMVFIYLRGAQAQ